jgi:deoxyadenosine/deoxycytidine kinase
MGGDFSIQEIQSSGMAQEQKPLLVGVVGPCAAGKTTLIANLRASGVVARHIAQEHSYVADMWRRITNPDVLIFLDVSYEVTLKRRRLNWTRAEYEEEQRRLRHARQHADLVIFTDQLTPEQVRDRVLAFISSRR